ncbi:diaminopimelate decarboxylase [Agrococcus carbonis]|uniref:Diaminopimelate decarboxylase n=1 Tax=Agrococcus carbonis TaxID=684552 RepID=A0A1H1S751_9MICO|nr:diaminopimelate decarboxylase [Agrococcus carbonis]SDS43119.1 diaminopimelate decarboxylase [Agrococcus carbonis]
MPHPLAPQLPDVADANALAHGVWPASAERVDGALHVGGADLREIAQQHGTPFLLVDETEVRDRARRIRTAFDAAFAPERGAAGVDVYYAGKALLTADIARWMRAEGLRIDVCTGGELALALRAGVEPEAIGFHGNNKSELEIEAGVAAGIGTFIIDSAIEAERISAAAARAGRAQRVRLRISVGVHASTHEFLATSHEDQKFGIPLAEAPAVVARIRELPGLELVGLHTHIGSQIFDADGFAESARRMLALHAELGGDDPLPELNLGGGFGIAYTAADSPEPIEAIAEGLADAVRAAAAELGVAVPRIAIEPGRWIVGPAGVTVYEVGTIKPVRLAEGTRTYVSVDGGMADNARPALYDAQYSARIASRASDAEPMLARVAGRHCESGDIVVDAEWLPSDVAPGDLLAVATTGAYCHSLASNYNAAPRPPVLAVRDGAVRTLVRRETIDDLLARDAGLDAGLVAENPGAASA